MIEGTLYMQENDLFLSFVGALSSTTSKAMYRVDYPVFDWPKAPFPYLQYPLEEFIEENRAEEERCLNMVWTVDST